MIIRPALPSDAEPIARIYNYYVHNTVISFEEHSVPSQAMAERIREVAALSLPWLVAKSSGEIVGYAYASRWKDRSAYRYTVESAVYIDPDSLGVGYGSGLYDALLKELRQQEIHAVIGGIALPNPASIRLHEKFGFMKVAHFKEVGFKFGKWVDVGYWQLLIRGT